MKKMAERIEESNQRRYENRVIAFMAVTFVLGMVLL